MKAMVIAPTALLERCSTDIHMVLSQIYNDDKVYREFYRDRAARGEFVLLDNGAAELGESVSHSAVIEAVKDLKPTVVIAPDAIYKRTITVDRTLSFLWDYADELHSMGVQIMAVPQGRDMQEYLQCFKVFNDNPKVDWLGVSKFYTPKFDGGRQALLSSVASIVQKPCHLLGVWDSPWDVILERFPFVKSVDSARPVKMGLQGLPLKDFAKRSKMPDYFGIKDFSDGQLAMVDENVREFVRVVEN